MFPIKNLLGIPILRHSHSTLLGAYSGYLVLTHARLIRSVL
jgi:hypothetical protein